MIVSAYVVAEICHPSMVTKSCANFVCKYLSKTGPWRTRQRMFLGVVGQYCLLGEVTGLNPQLYLFDDL